jgi:hypothetical protein
LFAAAAAVAVVVVAVVVILAGWPVFIQSLYHNWLELAT